MPESRVSLQDVGYTETLHPMMERRKIAWGFQFQGERGRERGQGMTLGLAFFHVPSMACPSGPSRERGRRLSSRGLRWGLSRSRTPYQPAGLPEGGSWEPPTFVWRLSRLHWGSQHRSQGTQWSRCSREPSCPYSIRVWLISSVNVPPPLFLQAQEVKARPTASETWPRHLEGSFVFYLGQPG